MCKVTKRSANNFFIIDATCNICGKSGLKGAKGLNIHQHRNKACKRLSLIHSQQQEGHYTMTVNIRLPEARTWMRPQLMTSSDDYEPDVQQLFQEIANTQQQYYLLDRSTTLIARNNRRSRVLRWVYRLPISRYCTSLCLSIRRLGGNAFNKVKRLITQLATFLYLLICFVYYCLVLVVIIAAIYVVSYYVLMALQ